MKLTTLGQWAVSMSGETTSFLVEVGDQRILLDTGLNPCRQLTRAGVGLTSIDHLFLSHQHSDHASGFANFVFTRAVAARRDPAAARLSVYGSPATLEAARSMLHAFYPERDFDLNWIQTEPGGRIALEDDLALTFFQTDHTVDSIGLGIRNGDRHRLAFTGDTSLAPSVFEGCSGAEVLLGECFGTEEDFGPQADQLKHLTAEAVAELAERSGVERLVIFHMQQPYENRDRRTALIGVIGRQYKGEIIFPDELQQIG